MDFKELASQRFACRKYDGRKVEDEKIGQLKELIRMTPSALNLQPWKIMIIADKGLKDQLAPLAVGGRTQIPTCSHLLVLCANTDWESHINSNIGTMRTAGVPEENVKHYQMTLKGLFGQISPDQRLIESQKNVYLAAASAIYGAKSLGIDSCVIQGFDVAGYSKILNLPSGLVPTLLITLGYAADRPTPKNRLPEEEIFF
jgi:Nitroreductase